MTYIYIYNNICTYNCSVQIHGELISSFILFNCSHFLWSDVDTHIFTRASNSFWLSYLPFRLRRSPCLVSILSRSFHDHGILERMWCFWWVSKIVQKKWYPKVLMFSTSTKFIKFLNYWSLKQILGEKKQISLFPSNCTFRSIAVLWPEKYPKVGGWEVLLKLVFTTQEFPKYQGKITPLRINPSRKKLTFFQTSKPVPSWEQKVWFHLQRRFTNQEYHWKKTPVTIYPSSFWGIH